jgi:hypothetical protein
VSRPEPDPVARWIVAIVRHHLISSPERPVLPAMPDGVAAVEAHAVGELDTGLVATMADQSIRYFLVRVSEFDHR